MLCGGDHGLFYFLDIVINKRTGRGTVLMGRTSKDLIRSR